jgi:hypothetical protein
MVKFLVDWNRLLALLVFSFFMVVGFANGGISPGYFAWAAMSLAFIWWTDEFSGIVAVPPPILRFLAWVMLLLPVIAGVIVASVN